MNAIALALAFTAHAQSARFLDLPADLVKPVPAVNQVLARVNGVEIKTSDVDALLWEWRKAEVVNELVTFGIVRDAAKKEDISATDAEVKKEVAALLEGIKTNLPAGQTIEQAMEQEGTSPSRLFIRVKTEVLLRKLILKGFQAKDYVKVSTIVIKPASASTDDLRVALEKADKAYNRLVGGEQWLQVLTAVTTDERAIASEGQVGWRPLSIFPETVRTDVAALKKGGFTKPAQTPNGIQIFRIDALGRQPTADELQELQESYVGGQRQGVMAKLRGAAKVEKF